MIFHYFLQDQAGFLRVGYIASESRDAATDLLQKAHIRELMGLTEMPQDAVPSGARYMYPFEGTWRGNGVRGTVEGETIISALDHLHTIFDGNIAYVAERPPVSPEERTLLVKQTAALISTLSPVQKAPEELPNAVATVLDKQFFGVLDDIMKKTRELLRERQFAEEVQEMHRTIFALEQQHEVSLKDKYDALSYVLRELSYIEDGLDPSPLKRDLRQRVDTVVELLKKVEKSMVRTAFHMDNARIHQDAGDTGTLAEETATLPDVALSRYASRKRLVSDLLLGMRSMQAEPAMAEGVPGAGPVPENAYHDEAGEPMTHMLLRELPLFLEWFVGFSLVVIILGQILQAAGTPVIVAGYNLTDFLHPFAWQRVFLKTTLVALLGLMGLRAQSLLSASSVLRWGVAVLLLVLAALFLVAL